LEPYLQLGILLDMEKNYAEGESILQAGLRVSPSDWQPYYRLGVVYQHSGKYEEAVKELQTAVKLEPTPASAHYNLGIAYGRAWRIEQGWHFGACHPERSEGSLQLLVLQREVRSIRRRVPNNEAHTSGNAIGCCAGGSTRCRRFRVGSRFSAATLGRERNGNYLARPVQEL
jgi:hypothetical protein